MIRKVLLSLGLEELCGEVTLQWGRRAPVLMDSSSREADIK